MPFALLKYAGRSLFYVAHAAERHSRRPQDLKPTYDVVIIGAGGHGLAADHYLATRHGITNIAVRDGTIAGRVTSAVTSPTEKSSALTTSRPTSPKSAHRSRCAWTVAHSTPQKSSPRSNPLPRRDRHCWLAITGPPRAGHAWANYAQ